MIQITDTYEEIKQLFEKGGFQREAYQAYATGISKALPEMLWEDIREYDFEKDVLPVLESLFARRHEAEAAHESFLKAACAMEEKCAALPCGKIDSNVVFYLGLCNGAGWATELDGRPAVLLGLEKIVELGWTGERDMIGLLYHELGHQWHFQNRMAESREETAEEKAVWQLYTEGVAMRFEQMMCGDPRFYHQDTDGWLDWCEENRGRLALEYLKRVENGESIQDFFGDWCAFEGHSDVGYYLGAEAIRLAQEENGLQEVLDFSLEQVLNYLKRLS